MQQASTSHSRQYQGYPYSNPIVIDAPSIDAATAVRWTNLPRTQVRPPTRRDEERQVVYIDIPEEAGPSGESQSADRPRPSLPDKKEPDDTPVVYIDLPDEAGGSGVSQNREEDEESQEPSFVQETIFYDPFENRRIDLSKGESIRSSTSVNSESDLDSLPASTPSGLRPAPRPPRPDNLELAGSTSVTSPVISTPSAGSVTPSPLSRPNDGYHSRQDSPESTFPSPHPASEFPEPPPAYTEIDAVRTPRPVVEQQPRRREQEIQQDPPRTQVILPETRPFDHSTRPLAIGLPNYDRKYLNCHHCGMRVHTLVVREIGSMTHLIALMFIFLCLLPIVALIYCADCLKNKNHYCPNCNKLIGYQLPLGDRKIVYVN